MPMQYPIEDRFEADGSDAEAMCHTLREYPEKALRFKVTEQAHCYFLYYWAGEYHVMRHSTPPREVDPEGSYVESLFDAYEVHLVERDEYDTIPE